jgi:hypothetical protein
MINLNAYPRVSFSELSQREAAQTTVLTVNNRLARRIVQDFAVLRRTQTTVGEIPLIVPWSGWISQQLVQASFHASLNAHAVLLDAFGAQLLWGRVIDALEADEPLDAGREPADAGPVGGRVGGRVGGMAIQAGRADHTRRHRPADAIDRTGWRWRSRSPVGKNVPLATSQPRTACQAWVAAARTASFAPPQRHPTVTRIPPTRPHRATARRLPS